MDYADIQTAYRKQQRENKAKLKHWDTNDVDDAHQYVIEHQLAEYLPDIMSGDREDSEMAALAEIVGGYIDDRYFASSNPTALGTTVQVHKFAQLGEWILEKALAEVGNLTLQYLENPRPDESAEIAADEAYDRMKDDKLEGLIND